MRVGLVIREQRPEYGGAFTFQGEVLRAFCRLRGESRHEFVVLCPTRQLAEFARTQFDPDAAAIATYAEPERNPPGLAQKITRRVRRSLPKHVEPGTRERVEQLARERDVQFIWSVSHGDACFDIPYMTIVWDLEHRSQPWFPEIAAQGIWELREAGFAHDLPRATFVITGTQVGKREIEDFYGVPAGRIRILPHPTPSFDDVAPGVEAPLPAALGERPFLLYPAQFWPHKNQVNLILALALLRDAGVDFDLALVGADKGNRAYVERVAEQRRLAQRVHFLGFVERPLLVTLYRRAFALAYMSFCGPENLPPLEAFALGCPVVASDIPGAREQLGSAALLVDPADPAGIARGIGTLRDDAPLREQLVARGRERAAAWTPQHFVRGVFGILDEFEAVRRAWP